MKRIVLFTTALLTLASCKKSAEASIEQILQSNDVASIKKYKADLDKKRQGLSDQINQLNAKIEALEPNKNIPLVTTFVAKSAPFVHHLELQGNVKTKQNILVYPETPGTIKSIFVRQGQYVSKGQAIARIDDGGLNNQLAQIQTAEALAKTTYERQERLWKQKIGSEIQYLQAKANYESQTNAVAQLEKTIARYTVKAPFSGVVDQLLKEPGAVVGGGMGSEICRVVNLSNMYIETDVPESYLSSIKKGKKVEVEFPVLGKTLNSSVRQTSNYIDPANRTFKVEIYVPNKKGEIKPNLTAKLKINDYTSKDAILIPQSIISENAEGKQYVYILDKVNGKEAEAKQVFITLGKTQGDNIEVLEGLTSGMQLINEGARTIKGGQKVEISNFSTQN